MVELRGVEPLSAKGEMKVTTSVVSLDQKLGISNSSIFSSLC